MNLIETIETSPVPITVPKMAAIMGVSADHIYDLVKGGTMPAFRLGAKWLFDPHITAKWLREQFNVPIAS